MGSIARFLNFWSGVDNVLLQWCPHHERQKYTSIGVLVLLTGVFASLASGYAFLTVFESIPVAIVLGILWGFLILNIDRLLLMTFPKSEKFYRQLLHAVPRLVLAVIIGATIAHPIMLRLFEPEILGRIKEDDILERKKERDGAKEQVRREATQARLKLPELGSLVQRKKERQEAATKRDECDKDRSEAEKAYLCEADGTCGSHIKSCGPICREKKKAFLNKDCGSALLLLERADAALKEAEVDFARPTKDLEAALSRAEEKIDREYNESIDDLSSRKRSFLTRSEGLGKLSNDNSTTAITCLAVSLLIILVEIVSVLVKIIAPTDSADRLAAATRDAFGLRIPDLAKQLAVAGGPLPALPSELPPPIASPVLAEQTASAGKIRHRIIQIVVTIFITGGMYLGGSSAEAAFAAGALFVALAPALVSNAERPLIVGETIGRTK